MFSNSSIGKKLLYAFFVLTIISIGIGYVSFRNMEHNSEVFTEIISGTSPRVQALLEMKNISNEIANTAFQIQTLHHTNEDEQHPENATQNMTGVSDSKSVILVNLEQLLRWIEVYRKASTDTDTRVAAFLFEINQSKSAIIASTLEYVDAREQQVDPKILIAKQETLNRQIATLQNLIEISIAEETASLRVQKQNADREMKDTLLLTGLMTGISVCVALFAWILLSRLIVRPLQALRDASRAIAGGNMEIEIPITSKDEIADLAMAFNNMARRLRETHSVLISNNVELEKVKKEIETKFIDTDRMNKQMINRELKMVELKKEITLLKEKIGPVS